MTKLGPHASVFNCQHIHAWTPVSARHIAPFPRYLLTNLRRGCLSADSRLHSHSLAWSRSHSASAVTAIASAAHVFVALRQDPVIGAEALEFTRVWVALRALRQTAAHAVTLLGHIKIRIPVERVLHHGGHIDPLHACCTRTMRIAHRIWQPPCTPLMRVGRGVPCGKNSR